MLRFAEREAEAAEAAVGEERREAINAQEDKENLRTWYPAKLGKCGHCFLAADYLRATNALK